MGTSEKIRIDKFLWAARIFKTRSIASEACRKGRISVNNIAVKPSHAIAGGEIISVKKPPVVHTYKVIIPIQNRVSAKLAGNCIRDLTTEDEKNKLIIARSSGFGIRPKGFGRPTKKERRSIDRISESNADF